MFQKLVKYKKQHKNTMVPNCSGKDSLDGGFSLNVVLTGKELKEGK